jgi:hypothetical protein
VSGPRSVALPEDRPWMNAIISRAVDPGRLGRALRRRLNRELAAVEMSQAIVGGRIAGRQSVAVELSGAHNSPQRITGPCR